VTGPFLPLARLLVAGRRPDVAVAARAGGIVAWEGFTAGVGTLAATLASRGGDRWVLFAEDSHAFAAGLLAIWQAGATAVVAPNGQPGTLQSMSAHARGVVTERRAFVPGADNVDPLDAPRTRTWRWRSLDRGATRLELYTSGTTGARKPIVKTLAHLEDEVAALEHRWGDRLRDARVFATVSHQHIYGLLFRVLWPLAAGRVFRADTYLLAEELAAQMASGGASCLVSTPVHLRRLAASADAARVAASCGTIFSSGGPLAAVTAARLGAVFGAAPFEIFGSTETGGVGWRQQGAGDDPLAWTPLPGVAATSIDGRLEVRSPFVSAADHAFVMADRAEVLPGGRFRVAGRSDRVAKIGDKRLALPDMEAALREHPWVADVVLAVLDRGGVARVAAVVVPAPAGRDALAQHDRRTVGRTLAERLEPYWDRVLLPRTWRYVERLPEDAQGKVTDEAVQRLLAAEGEADEDDGERVCERAFEVPHDLPCLDGHFPGFPIVPGFVQITWAMEAARALTGRALAVERIEALKFTGVLRPGDVVRLRVAVAARDATVTFRLWNDRTQFSSGRCRLAPAGAASA
jgi:acyl-coenzyme A synthetase/AMP-(fatty) acid ligase